MFKVLLCRVDGSSYKTSYTHFRRDHNLPQNVLLHLLCFAFQALSNFAFLAEVDDKLEAMLTDSKLQPGENSAGVLSTLTIVVWSIFLLRYSRGAPVAAKAAAIGALLLAFRLRHRLVKCGQAIHADSSF